ncbi:hypothetical protein B0H21DRAFT_711921 [Amylocystis lapponica]|nr:hypothetical protein B0H21DRAFT_711921 [Amylocystis lapponica]
MPSSATDIDVFLRQDIYDSDVEHSALLNVWDDLSQASVEITLANYPSFSEFVENNCLYCAAIQIWIPAEKEEPEDDSAAEQSHSPYSDHTSQPPQRQPSVPPPLLDHFGTEKPENDFPTAWNTVPTPDAHLAPEQSWPPTPELDRKVSKKDGSRSDPLELKTIGLVFLTSQVASEISICVGLLPPYRGKGFGAEAVRLALQWAFDDIQCHRVQALLLDSPTRDRALRLFTTFGFAHEGTRRRAVMGARGWCDVTCMGMLDTEWLVRAGRSASGPRSMWDELFQRHQKEREELLRGKKCTGRSSAPRAWRPFARLSSAHLSG